MVWACMAAAGTGHLVIVEETIDSRVYLSIVSDAVVQEWQRLCGNGWTFQQDNAPVHTARIVQQWFKDAGVVLLEQPPQSPDLSPIENAWALMKSAIARRKPSDLTTLRQYIV